MAGTTSKRAKATGVKQATIGQAIALLQDLPEKPKEELSLKEAVSQMQTEIRGALAKGYTYSDIATALKGKGIKISALTLKNYVPVGKHSAFKTKAKSTKISTGDAAALGEPPKSLATAPVATAIEPVPATKSRQRVSATLAEAELTAQPKTKAKQPRVSKKVDDVAIAPPKAEAKQPRTQKVSKASTADAPPPGRRRRKA